MAGWIAAAALFLALAAVSLIHFREQAPVERTLRYTIAPPQDSNICCFAVSRDGRTIVIAALSPDIHWMAYAFDRSGQREV